MGMTIEEAIRYLDTYSNTMGSGQTTQEQHEESKRVSIDTMRKYQKIEEIVKEWREVGLEYDSCDAMMNIERVLQEPTTKNDSLHCQHTDEEIAKSFIEDVEAVKTQLPTIKNDLGVDCIDRVKAQTAIEMNAFRYTLAKERGGMGQVEWSDQLIKVSDAADIIRTLPSVTPQEPRWIPVSERLPEDLEPVNITWVNHNPESYYMDIKDKPFTATGHFCNGRWWWYSVTCQDYLNEYGRCDVDTMDDDIEVIAWMPLPKPYEP